MSLDQCTGLYPGLSTAVKLKNGVSKKFDVRVGVNQETVLSLCYSSLCWKHCQAQAASNKV